MSDLGDAWRRVIMKYGIGTPPAAEDRLHRYQVELGALMHNDVLHDTEKVRLKKQLERAFEADIAAIQGNPDSYFAMNVSHEHMRKLLAKLLIAHEPGFQFEWADTKSSGGRPAADYRWDQAGYLNRARDELARERGVSVEAVTQKDAAQRAVIIMKKQKDAGLYEGHIPTAGSLAARWKEIMDAPLPEYMRDGLTWFDHLHAIERSIP